MKFKIIFFLLLITFSLSSITLIDGKKSHEISLEQLKTFQQKKMETHREKNGKVKVEKWTGVALLNILQEFQITDYDQLRFTSEDNYQVRLTKTEIEDYKPIIALKKNGKPLNEDKIRLIVPQIRDMFWIQGIAEITTEQLNEMPLPYTIFTAESILKEMELIADPTPFKDMSGYFFIDFVDDVFPMLRGEFLLISSDGVSHKLDFDKYLKNAVLIFDAGKYNLQSPDMPGGMWIKNLAYIQMFDRVIFFRDQFFNWHDLAKLAGWKETPKILIDQDGNQIGIKINFDDPKWQIIKKVTWQE
ncbi:MAG: molybdopterin-dependent oxidoreductase [Candidatus Cloacimonetes bacterium]|nr:molybdopterin-dependent oxidoreductase [Candidatus Cloacimonadota bacterium]MCF7814841.1 molybdopterin-dependent oxidoreductase [Candidatus Cloacimonadota bacterium]MCF7867897.1 molybdopterin-dependent oxidoreductase [Candidatus Cloacimonadota bacterium]MCF7883716.1 molybdopterin-dependent oxidoreductase [Candidatus Cloacimonadota bacterium]